ncbi:MAG: SLC13 family permease [Paeniglutamicibacter terrestris]|uniref:Citrate:proton symporter n=1 Tax=Paeniglutamicibacter terrestris TaxID=2723403 RepID=A0ABX1G571_9MICC|nr:SLC13 family permease [Paeniglutamicibacter terrestris]ASN40668.1 citrate:proton symporter [Arthrobacter sp. 7749]NKG21158.1 citrate:proton symporter [Paeniglutamicibacter terrestris]
MLVALGFLMVATFMALIMTKRMTPLLALIIVPTVFGLFAGAGLGIGDMVMEAVKSMSSTAALLMFAIMYFGIMIDVGLFDKLVDGILRLVGNDPAKVVLGTALLTGLISLDGDGSTTFIVVTAALLPIYQRLGMSPVVLTCVAGLTNGTLNIVPWGGPTARAAAALHVDASAVFVPMIPALAVGLVVVFAFAWAMGVSERKRLQREDPLRWGPGSVMTAPSGSKGSTNTKTPSGGRGVALLEKVAVRGDGTEPVTMNGTALDPNRETLRPKLFFFNLAMTVAIMVLLVLDLLPLSYLFMIGTAVALLVNFPRISDQAKMIASHSSEVIAVVSMVLAAAVLTGVLSGTGMVDAMSAWLVDVIPTSMGPYLAILTGIISIPATFFMSNDAFYFGILPVLTEAGAHYGIPAVDMARASITGQPVHMQSPLVPAILLLVSMSRVDLGDHHKKVLWRALIVSLVMLATGVLIGAIGIG